MRETAAAQRTIHVQVGVQEMISDFDSITRREKRKNNEVMLLITPQERSQRHVRKQFVAKRQTKYANSQKEKHDET
jgi:hypothetical protein